MKTRKWVAINNKSQNFVIKEDSKVGFYVFVYNNGNERCIRDYLQDTFEQAKSFALRYFDVQENSWKQVNNDNV